MKDSIIIKDIKFTIKSYTIPKEGSKEWYVIINKTPSEIRKETLNYLRLMINGETLENKKKRKST